MTTELRDIALNAIRYRAATEDKPSMASDDRRWLLRYIDRLEAVASKRCADHLRLFEIGLERDDAFEDARAFIRGHRALWDDGS